ncbi:hypothetical protein [uncultured Anaerococcus sp.]|uniref:hypothetical protein n=1 Tax=uncultured Anaerococcus sp. TaxID=293428 RepID=UPI002889F896|nr:hypothetical protein [uncultured Anaerococcus sp.]
MLIDPIKFNELEVVLREKGKLEEFEKESGEILGRAMITLGEIPEELKREVLKDYNDKEVYVFNCSFDFYDSYLGIALEKQSLRPISSIWITDQQEGSDVPSQDWIKFFVRVLAEYVINNDGGFGIPLYIFVNDDSELVIEPTF